MAREGGERPAQAGTLPPQHLNRGLESIGCSLLRLDIGRYQLARNETRMADSDIQ